MYSNHYHSLGHVSRQQIINDLLFFQENNNNNINKKQQQQILQNIVSWHFYRA